MKIRTDHRIAVVAGELRLVDTVTREVIVTAHKAGDDWEVTAGEHSTVASPAQAVQAMVDMALQVLPGPGYSTWVPHNLSLVL